MAYDNGDTYDGDEFSGESTQEQRTENFLFILLVGVLCCVILASCWYYLSESCHKNTKVQDSQKEEDSVAMKRLVVAEEIRPGLLLVQGNKDEIHKIVNQYDTLRRQESLQHYGACVNSAGHVPPRPSAPHNSVSGINGFTDDLTLPPPYVPGT